LTTITAGNILAINPLSTSKQVFTIDASKCASSTCNYNNPSVFKVTYRIAADPTKWFPDVDEVFDDYTFQVLKIYPNPSATKTFSASTTSFDMLNAFKTNWDSVVASGYDWLKKGTLKCTFTCVNHSVVQMDTDHDYCAMTFQ